MVELIIGAAIGAGVVIAKDNMSRGSQDKQAKMPDNDPLYAENEKLRQLNTELKRKVEDMHAENQKLSRKFRDKDEDADDLQDDLEDAKLKIKKLQHQIQLLEAKNAELQRACESYEMENKK